MSIVEPFGLGSSTPRTPRQGVVTQDPQGTLQGYVTGTHVNIEGLDSRFQGNLMAMIDESGGRMQVLSGFRSVEQQQKLWDQALVKYGSEAAARKWVAKPGSSNHNHGVAADIRYSQDGQAWAHENAWRYGLHFPLNHEPWHIEPIGVRGGTYQSDAADPGVVSAPGHPDAYTDPLDGALYGQTQEEDNGDLETQLKRIHSLVMFGDAAPVNPTLQRGDRV